MIEARGRPLQVSLDPGRPWLAALFACSCSARRCRAGAHQGDGPPHRPGFHPLHERPTQKPVSSSRGKRSEFLTVLWVI